MMWEKNQQVRKFSARLKRTLKSEIKENIYF